MKKTVINVFKTLFFFDLAVIVFSCIPEFHFVNPAKNVFYKNLLQLVLVAVLTAVFIFFVEKKQRKTKINLKSIGNNTVLGIAAGIVLPLFAAAILLLFGKLGFIGVTPFKNAWLWALSLFCEAATFEMLLRGYLFKLYRKDYGFIASAVITTLLFLSMNTGIFSKSKLYAVNIILLNIFLCVLVDMTDSVFTAVVARFSYTVLSCLLLGSLKLESGYPQYFNCAFSGNKIFCGGDFKLEGSVLITVLTAAFILLFLNQKYKLIKKSAFKNLRFKKK